MQNFFNENSDSFKILLCFCKRETWYPCAGVNTSSSDEIALARNKDE